MLIQNLIICKVSCKGSKTDKRLHNDRHTDTQPLYISTDVPKHCHAINIFVGGHFYGHTMFEECKVAYIANDSSVSVDQMFDQIVVVVCLCHSLKATLLFLCYHNDSSGTYSELHV